MLGKILTLIVVFLIIRFVIKYIVPIFQMTRMAKEKLGQMQQNMEDMQRRQSRPESSQGSIDGEYIDYEEVK